MVRGVSQTRLINSTLYVSQILSWSIYLHEFFTIDKRSRGRTHSQYRRITDTKQDVDIEPHPERMDGGETGEGLWWYTEITFTGSFETLSGVTQRTT